MSRELLKWMGEGGMTEFTDLLNAIWKRTKIPEEWTQGILHPLEKVKGKVGLDNIRPITLLEVALKTKTGLLSDRMLKAWQRENILHEQQYGFRKHTSMTDAIMIFRLMQEHGQMETALSKDKAGEGFHALMMDLRKAYDSCEFWATELGCRSLGVPEEIIQFFKATEVRMQTRIHTAHGLTEPVNIKRGMLQGDSASPARFLAFMNPALVIVNKYSRGIKSPTGEKVAAVCAVDDTILYASNQKDMQETTDIYVDWLNFVKMEANVEKCIHIRSIPRELKTEELEKQIGRIKWEATEKYKEWMEEALEETGWEKLEEGTIRTQILSAVFEKVLTSRTRGLHFQPVPPKVHPVPPREVHGCSQFWKRAGSEFPAFGVWPLGPQPADSGVLGAQRGGPVRRKGNRRNPGSAHGSRGPQGP